MIEALAIPKKSFGREYPKQNLSSIFLLPLILVNGNETEGFINSYLINTSENDISHDNHYLYVLMSEEKVNFINSRRYVSHIQLEDSKYMYKFDISDVASDVKLYLEGKYSKFSESTKRILSKEGKSSHLYGVLYRTKERKEELEKLIGQKLHENAEYYSSCYVEDEIY